MTRRFDIAVFRHDRLGKSPTFTAYGRDYSTTWPNCQIFTFINAENLAQAKKLAIAAAREEYGKARAREAGQGFKRAEDAL